MKLGVAIFVGQMLLTLAAGAHAQVWSIQSTENKMDNEQGFIISLDAASPHRDSVGRQQRAALKIQCTKKKLDVVFVADESFEYQGEYGSHTVRLKFDDGKPEKESVNASTSRESVFFRNGPRMVSRLLATKTLMVEYVPWRRSEQVIEFKVAGLDKFRPPLERCGLPKAPVKK